MPVNFFFLDCLFSLFLHISLTEPVGVFCLWNYHFITVTIAAAASAAVAVVAVVAAGIAAVVAAVSAVSTSLPVGLHLTSNLVSSTLSS